MSNVIETVFLFTSKFFFQDFSEEHGERFDADGKKVSKSVGQCNYGNYVWCLMRPC